MASYDVQTRSLRLADDLDSGWQLTLRRFEPSGALHGSAIAIPTFLGQRQKAQDAEFFHHDLSPLSI